MCVCRRKATVVAPPVDRAGIADARLPCHTYVFVVAEADDDVRRSPADIILRLDKAHGQRSCDLAMLITHENRAELKPALQACDCGLDCVDIAVWHEQIVAACVSGDHNRPRGNRLWYSKARRSVFLRPTANRSVLVVLARIEVCAVDRDAGQDRYVAAPRSVLR